MTLIAYYFRNYRHVFRQISKRPRLGIPFNSQHVKGSQTLPKYARQNIYLFFFTLRELSWKMSVLVIFEILRHFASSLTANFI